MTDASEKTVNIALTAGWNFVSFPAPLENPDIAAALSSIAGKYDTVARYNNQTGKFEYFVGHVKFNQFSTFEFGRGYLIHATQACQLIIAGPSATVITPTPMYAGYNLIAATANASAAELLQGVSYDFVYEYTGSGYVTVTTLQEGKSYFVHALGNATWNIPAGGLKEYSFAYDADGDRVRNTFKNASSVVEKDTVYVSDKYEIESTPGETLTRKHIFMGDRRVCTVEKKQSDGSVTYNYLLPDHLGSSDLVTDAAGVQIESSQYSPYGSTITDVGSYKTKYKFNGKELDDTNFYYYGARYYAHEFGRFLTVDTIDPDLSNPQTLNKYAYCLNNPLKYIDPDGHTPLLAAQIYVAALTSSPDFQNDVAMVQADMASGDYVAAAVDGVFAAVPAIPAGAGKIVSKVVSKVERLVANKAAAKVAEQAIRPTSERVFWSGSKNAKAAAEEAAKNSGAVTLEMTKAAERVEKAASKVEYIPEGKAKWATASERFARGAKGDVHVYRTRKVSKDSIWLTKELPALRKNPKVKRIIRHLVK